MWQDAQEKARKRLNGALTKETVLRFYDPEKTVKLSADASKDELEAVHLQQPGGDFMPVAYSSRAMTKVQ